MILHASSPDKGAAPTPAPTPPPRSATVPSPAPIAHCPSRGQVGELLHHDASLAVPGWERYGNCANCLSTVCAPGEHAGVMLLALIQAVADALSTTESELVHGIAMPVIKQRHAEITAKLALVA